MNGNTCKGKKRIIYNFILLYMKEANSNQRDVINITLVNEQKDKCLQIKQNKGWPSEGHVIPANLTASTFSMKQSSVADMMAPPLMAVPRIVRPFWKYSVRMASSSPEASSMPTTGHTLLGTHLQYKGTVLRMVMRTVISLTWSSIKKHGYGVNNQLLLTDAKTITFHTSLNTWKLHSLHINVFFSRM